jgi:alpha(1,3/1,4) fucosyltransferase
MKLGFWNFYNSFNGNRMFTGDVYTEAIDNLSHGTVYLGQRLRGLGHQVATLDMDKLENFDAAIFLDHPTFLNPRFRKLRRMGKKLYLFLYESPAYRPDNYWRWLYRDFEKVFTWNPKLADGRKVIQMWHTVKIPSPFSINLAEKTKFCVAITSQKYLSHPRRLDAERRSILRCFEGQHPDQFDLFGARWDRIYFTGRLSRLNMFLHRFYKQFPKFFRVDRHPCYRGIVPVKNPVMRSYKFAITYENSVFPGYVTEKIFDAFFAGCVPVYLGAPDVADYIPPETFIDRRNFGSDEDLYRYMSSLPEKEYLAYVSAIDEYVRGDRIQLFGGENLTQIFLREIVTPNLPATTRAGAV